tara:strand:- start:21 stop:758 length:738 start_codon:yes stop_codon:yes gene_type:complete
MGGKKKGGDKKKAAGKDDGEDLSVENFYKAYKKNIVLYNCEQSKYIKQQMEKYNEDPDDKIKHLKMNEELGWPGIKAITESLKTVAYPHLISIRLWKTYIEDEGVRAICEFMQKCSTVQCLELLDDKVTPLGCEFLGKTLTPGSSCPPISILKLDHNAFGSDGLKQLASGIKENIYIKMLSLTYCDIDQHGARSLFEMLIFSKSLLEELILTGNNLGNEGSKIVLNGVSIAKNLKKVYLADNNFN